MNKKKTRYGMKCICPMCGKTHNRKVDYWTGNGKPRVYCNSCRSSAKRYAGIMDKYAT